MLKVPFGYNLFLTSQAKKELAGIKKGNPRAAQKITKAIDEILFHPFIGEFLHGDLKIHRKSGADVGPPTI